MWPGDVTTHSPWLSIGYLSQEHATLLGTSVYSFRTKACAKPVSLLGSEHRAPSTVGRQLEKVTIGSRRSRGGEASGVLSLAVSLASALWLSWGMDGGVIGDCTDGIAGPAITRRCCDGLY